MARTDFELGVIQAAESNSDEFMRGLATGREADAKGTFWMLVGQAYNKVPESYWLEDSTLHKAIAAANSWVASEEKPWAKVLTPEGEVLYATEEK